MASPKLVTSSTGIAPPLIGVVALLWFVDDLLEAHRRTLVFA